MFTSRVGEFMVDEIDNVKVEVVVEDDTPAETVIDVVKKTADTRHSGDGRIFVIPVKASIRIREG